MSDGKIDALDLLSSACQKHGIHLSVLVAETGLWASPDIHRLLLERTGQIAFFPNTRRARAGVGEVRAQMVGRIRLDDNSYANDAIKRCIGKSRQDLVGFETCHIWPRTCYDARHHTALANIVLLPRPVAALSDHDPEIEAALQYRSFELYGWHPAEMARPEEPDFYPDCWREPMELTGSVKDAVHRRIERILGA